MLEDLVSYAAVDIGEWEPFAPDRRKPRRGVIDAAVGDLKAVQPGQDHLKWPGSPDRLDPKPGGMPALELMILDELAPQSQRSGRAGIEDKHAGDAGGGGRHDGRVCGKSERNAYSVAVVSKMPGGRQRQR